MAAEKSGWARTKHLLVILTTLVLDPRRNRYRPKTVDRLSRAAQEFIAKSPRSRRVQSHKQISRLVDRACRRRTRRRL